MTPVNPLYAGLTANAAPHGDRDRVFKARPEAGARVRQSVRACFEWSSPLEVPPLEVPRWGNRTCPRDVFMNRGDCDLIKIQ